MILKKIFIVTFILLMVTLVFFGIYLVAFKSETETIIANDETEEEVINMLAKKIINLTSDSVISATTGPQGDTIRYYDAITGKAWTMTLRGANKELMPDDNFNEVPVEAKWSLDGESVILKDKNNSIFTHNYATGEHYKLRDGMDDVVWTSLSGKILYKYYDKNTKERSLNIANSDGTNWKKIADLPFKDTTFVQIPSSIKAAFWPSADINTELKLYTVSTVGGGEPKEIFSGKKGADLLFSPNGEKILVSSVEDNGKRITLGVMDKDGQNYIDLKIPTIVQKTVWSTDSKTVYYAQPTDVPDSALWPNDYLDNKFETKDTFYKIDIDTNKKTRIVELDEITEKIDAINLFLSDSEDELFFINKIDGLLYRIKL